MIAKLYIYRLVDVADEIDIPRLKQRLKKLEMRPLKLDYFTPAYLNFTVPPLETREKSWFLTTAGTMIETQLKFYSLGSIGIRYQLELAGENYGEILAKARDIINGSNPLFEKKTQKITNRSRQLIEKELDLKTYNGFVEDYAILWIKDKFISGDRLKIKEVVTQFLRNETVSLSKYEQNEAFRYVFSYTPEDLTVVDWDRAVTIGEKEDDDVWDVLEYANLQLLQLRYYEFELNKRLTEIYKFARAERIPLLEFYKIQGLLKKTLEVFIGFTNAEERINNFLRLTGDEYLSRVYAAAAVRLNIKSIQIQLKEHLTDVKELYEMLSAEASAVRAEILEIIIIILIVFEIIYAFF